jgi:hypothetical protein
MPVIEDSVPLQYPKSDYSVVKYMDILKFISLLQRRALFFCRQDKFEDQFEGETARKNFDWRIRSLKHLNESGFFNSKMTDAEIQESIKVKYDFERKLKALRLITCWNKRVQESAALWKIYSDNGQGIMIKSSIGRIKKALSASSAEFRLTEVRYINFDEELMDDGNDFFLVSHKQEAYSYEEEVRLIHEITAGVNGWEYDWKAEESSIGKYFELDLSELIDEIVIGPYCPKWQFNIIEGVIEKYELVKKVSRSKLTIVN